MEAANQSAILNALSFDQMNERFFQVPEAAKRTFTWIFEDLDAQMSSNSQLKFPFKDWLASGSGIFHISGKPGSGKSTLMKYLFKHPETTSLLRAWAGERELVFTQCFFWKPGSILQKNLVGLVRSLLFSVLEQCPAATPDVFPRYWNPSEYLPWSSHGNMQLGDDEILAAFDHLVSNGDIYSDHRFCFFIDGLDEFEESSHHRDLVTKIEQWVKASAGDVKICVSSRELPVFQDHLDISQRIRLQDLTRRVIKAFVRERLGTEERFQNIRRIDEERCNRFEKEIVEKADGVFLWVALVLNMICEGLECRESLLDLERKLETTPRKLEDFFDYILDSISEGQRRKAFCTLSYAMAATGCRSKDCFNTKSYLFSPLSLLRFSFLDEYIGDPSFAKNRDYQEMHSEEIEERVAAAAAQVTGRCKGFLELRPNRHDISGSTVGIEPKVKLVVFTHRSVPEYLATSLQEKGLNHVKNFDAIDALIQTLIAVFNALPLDPGFTEDVIRRNLYFLVHEIREVVTRDKTPYFKSLEILDHICHRRQLEVHADFGEVRWKRYKSAGLEDYGDVHTSFYEIIHVAISLSFYEYTSWKILRSPDLLDDGPWLLLSTILPWLWGGYFLMESVRDTPLTRTMVSLRQLLQSLGVKVPGAEFLYLRSSPGFGASKIRSQGSCIWALILQELLRYNVKYDGEAWTFLNCWSAVEVFLEFGADIPSWRRIEIDVILLEFGGTAFKISEGWSWDDTLLPALLPALQDCPSDSVTLQDFVDYYLPPNAAAITRLLDQRAKSEIKIEPSEGSIFVKSFEPPKEQQAALRMRR
jgi:hypothetical protein